MKCEENDVNEDITAIETDEIPKLDINETKQIHPRSKHKSGVYSCPQCESTFSAQSSLKRHQASVHEGLKGKYSCNHCEYSGLRDNLSRHIKSVHKAVKYFCKVCDYQTGDQSNLRKHRMSKHEGVKSKYNCDQCEYWTGWKKHVIRHKKAKHSIIL